MAALAFTAILAGCGLGSEPLTRFNGTDITAAGWGSQLALTDHTGRPRNLADFKGKVVLLYFGYTNCPGPCPTALAEMAQVVTQIGADRVQGLFVTVDPERDTSEKLASYVSAFHPSILGLRGSNQELEKVTKEFKVHYQAQKDDKSGHSMHGADHGSYMVDHSTGIYVFDTQGRLRLFFSANGRSVEAMVHDVKILLEQ